MSRWTTESAACWLVPDVDGLGPLAQFEAWCAAHAGCRGLVWLGSGLLLPLFVGPELPLRDEPALRAWAQRVFGHYGVPASAALATWRSGRRLGAVTLEGLDLVAVRAVARRHRVRLVGVRPGWALALQQLLARDPGLARASRRAWLLEPGLATALQLEHGQLTGVAATWGRADELALPPDEPVYAAPCARPPARGPAAPDFLAAPVRRESAAGWALAATGALALAVAVADAGAWKPAPQAGSTAFLPAPAAAGDATWAERAAHPWGQVFAATEAASVGGVSWLRWEHDAARGGLRLSGQAAGVGEALAAVDRLAAADGVTGALLAHSERVAAGGEVRFEMQAQWSPAAVR